MDKNEIHLNRLANITAMLLLFCDNFEEMRRNDIFKKVVGEKVALDKAVANMAIFYSAADAALSKFAKGAKKIEGEDAMWQSFEEVQHLSKVISKMFDALAEIDTKHHLAISTDFSAVLAHYRQQPNKLMLSQSIEADFRERLKKDPALSFKSYQLGRIDTINSLTDEK